MTDVAFYALAFSAGLRVAYDLMPARAKVWLDEHWPVQS